LFAAFGYLETAHSTPSTMAGTFSTGSLSGSWVGCDRDSVTACLQPAFLESSVA
jgi:hypothetical protein